MKLEKYPDPMHPEAEHNYSFDFTDLLAAIGDGASTVASAVISIDGVTPAGFTATFVSIDATNLIVNWLAGVGTSDHADDAYKAGGSKVCIQCNIVTSTGEAEVQQGILQVTDQC